MAGKNGAEGESFLDKLNPVHWVKKCTGDAELAKGLKSTMVLNAITNGMGDLARNVIEQLPPQSTNNIHSFEDKKVPRPQGILHSSEGIVKEK